MKVDLHHESVVSPLLYVEVACNTEYYMYYPVICQPRVSDASLHEGLPCFADRLHDSSSSVGNKTTASLIMAMEH